VIRGILNGEKQAVKSYFCGVWVKNGMRCWEFFPILHKEIKPVIN